MAFARLLSFLGTAVAAAAVVALLARVAIALGAAGSTPSGILGWIGALEPAAIATSLAAGALLVVLGAALQRAIRRSLGL